MGRVCTCVCTSEWCVVCECRFNVVLTVSLVVCALVCALLSHGSCVNVDSIKIEVQSGPLKMRSKCDQNEIKMSSKWDQNVIKMWSTCDQNVIKMWRKCDQRVNKMWSKCNPKVIMHCQNMMWSKSDYALPKYDDLKLYRVRYQFRSFEVEFKGFEVEFRFNSTSKPNLDSIV